MESTAVVDTHCHFWDLQKFNYVWPSSEQPPLFQNFLPNDFEEETIEDPVKNVIFVQVVNNTLNENYWIFELAKKFKSIIGVVGWVDLTQPDKLQAVISELKENPLLVGFRHITELEASDWLARDDVHKSLSIIQDNGLTFDLLVRPPFTSPYVSQIASKFPRLKLIVDHIGKPNIKEGNVDDDDDDKHSIYEWKRDITEAAKYPNVYCKLSGMVTEADLNKWKPNDLKPFVQFCLQHFGAERCMFGSDYPVYKMADATYSQVYKTLDECLDGCTVEQKRGIFQRNALKIYGIKVPLNE
ncbi:L-fucono-1,5-lactonase-like [Glandiceps talaboti]